MLEVGIKAPDFELPDQNGKIHRLSDYTGKKVILYFYWWVRSLILFIHRIFLLN